MNQVVTFLFVLLMTLGVARAQVKLDPDFVKFKTAGDACFQKKDYTCARKNYQSALIIKENDTYCQRQLTAIQNAEKRQQQAQTAPSPKVESSKPTVAEPQRPTISQARPVNGYRRIWDRTLGGEESDDLSSVIATSDGGYLLAGNSSSDASGDKSERSKGDQDYWVIKLSASGDKQWDRTFGGNKNDNLSSMIATRDGGYLLAGNSDSDASGDKTGGNKGDQDYWVVKIDASGDKLWDRTFGGSKGDYLSSIIATSDGGYLLGGNSRSDVGGDKTGWNRGDQDYWVVKLSASGDKQWDRTLGGNKADFLKSIVATRDGGYLLAGSSLSDNIGDKTEGNKGELDYWVVKLDASGDKLWDRTFGGKSYDNLTSMLVTHDGGYLLGGESKSDASGNKTGGNKGELDYWVVKLDASGDKLWDRTFGGNKSDGLHCMIATPDGGYLLGGSLNYDASDKTEKIEARLAELDYWIVKIDASGAKLWDQKFGGNKYDSLTSIVATRDGGYLLAGSSQSDASGDKIRGNKGDQDYWVIKVK